MSRLATIPQCVIDARHPGSFREVAGRPFLAWQMREMVRYGVENFVIRAPGITAAARAATVHAAERLPRRVSVGFCDTPPAAGLLAPRFLHCLGHVLFAGSLAGLLSDAAADPAVTISRRQTCGQEQTGIDIRNPASLDFQADSLPPGGVSSIEGWGVCVDITSNGGADRAEQGAAAILDRPALFLDRDGVINVDHGYVATRARWEWVPGALKAIRNATDHGWHVFVVTNQSGIARGLYTEAEAQEMLAWMCDEVLRHGGAINDVRYCPHHPDAMLPDYRRESDWRKPGPGMLLDLLARWTLNPSRCVMVGDQLRDVQAGEAAGMRAVQFPGGNLEDFVAPLIARGLGA